MSQFAGLAPHLADENRRRALLAIEAGLREHPFPPQVVVENTSVCNLRCIHCSHREMERPQRPMARDLWEKIVGEIGREAPGTEVWPTFYGEALILGDELWDRLEFAARAGCRNLILNSNGTLLDRGDTMAKVLRSPLRRFILSLDGFSTEVFEQIRVKGRRDRIYAATEELCRRAREAGGVAPVIVVQFSVMKENVAEVEPFRRHWHALGAEVKIRPMLEWTATGSVRTATIAHGSTFRIACPWANHTMAILQDGRVAACAVDYGGRLDAGNVRDSSISELWARLGTTLRKRHREHRWKELPPVCQGCGDWQVAGAEYEAEVVPGTRPFWFYEGESGVNAARLQARGRIELDGVGLDRPPKTALAPRLPSRG